MWWREGAHLMADRRQRQEGERARYVFIGHAFSGNKFNEPHLPIMLPYYESIKGPIH